MARSEISGTAGIPSPRLLAAARILAGLSQRELADLAGVHRTVIGRYESGSTLMRADRLEQVMIALRARGVRFLEPCVDWDGGLAFVRREPEPDLPVVRPKAVVAKRVRKA